MTSETLHHDNFKHLKDEDFIKQTDYKRFGDIFNGQELESFKARDPRNMLNIWIYASNAEPKDMHDIMMKHASIKDVIADIKALGKDFLMQDNYINGKTGKTIRIWEFLDADGQPVSEA